MRRGLRRLTAVVSAALLAVTLQVVVAPVAQAGT